MHGDETIDSGNEYLIESGKDWGRLTLKDTSGKSSGTYKVTAENSAGSDSAEFTVEVKDRPSPPPNLRVVEVYKDFIVVAWDVPESDGGSPITGYLLEKRDAKRDAFVKVEEVDSKTLKVKATKLVEGKAYYFRVLAENDVGQSDWTTMDEPVTAKLPFGEYRYHLFHFLQHRLS